VAAVIKELLRLLFFRDLPKEANDPIDYREPDVYTMSLAEYLERLAEEYATEEDDTANFYMEQEELS